MGSCWGELSHSSQAGVHTYSIVQGNMSHLEVGHEVFEDWRTFLLQQVLQADDQRNRVLNEGLLLDLWAKTGDKIENPSPGKKRMFILFTDDNDVLSALRALTCDTTFFCAACRTAFAMVAILSSSSGSSPAAPPDVLDMACSFISARLKTLKVSLRISTPSVSRGSSSSAKHAGRVKSTMLLFSTEGPQADRRESSRCSAAHLRRSG